MKSDQEPSIVDVLREVAARRTAPYGTGIEHSAVGESDTNATIERAIQDVEGQLRTLRAALEEKVQQKIRLDHPIVPWMVRHSAALITRCRVRPNGRTPLEMMKGHKTHSKITEFGEIILFKIPKTKFNPGKFEDRWDTGVYVGFDIRSMETLVATPAGVFKVLDFKRRPLQERWSAGIIGGIAGSPKQPVPGQSYERAPAFSKKFATDRARNE